MLSLRKFFLMISFCVACTQAWAGLSKFDESLLSFFFAGQKIAAIQTDMDFYFGWRRLDRDEWKAPALKAVAELEKIKTGLPKDLPADLEILRSSFLTAVNHLETLYHNVESKNDLDFEKEQELFIRATERFNGYLERVASVMPMTPLADDFDPLDEEMKAFPPKDRDRFREAAAEVEEKKFDKARITILSLLKEYQGSVAEGSLVLRLALASLPDEDAEGNNTEILKKIEDLSQLLHSGRYYPNLVDSYLTWRSAYQEYRHGISETSIIPNHLYVETIDIVCSAIKKHLETSGTDEWARVQLFMLAQLPVIPRGSSGKPSPGVIPALYGEE
ncbi:MAG: hypothetical protein HQL16_02760 [Candidatus Omnitrophica bacterium]|nr:hypothetical protein [Candidatus Omnitrophota bacterium]